jgi:hypothetical protein
MGQRTVMGFSTSWRKKIKKVLHTLPPRPFRSGDGVAARWRYALEITKKNTIYTTHQGHSGANARGWSRRELEFRPCTPSWQ